MGGAWVGAGERREHALVFRARLGGGVRQAVEVVAQAAGAVEVLDQAALPRRREVERADQRREQADVAHAQVGLIDAVVGGRLEPERDHFRVGRGDVAPAERFDAALRELARRVRAIAEHRAEVAEARGLPGGGRGEVIPGHRDGQVRAQAQLLAARVGGQVKAFPDVLARQVEERFGRLEQGGLRPDVARAFVMGEQRRRPPLRPGVCRARRLVHGRTRGQFGRGFSTGCLRFRRGSPGGINAGGGAVVNEWCRSVSLRPREAGEAIQGQRVTPWIASSPLRGASQ